MHFRCSALGTRHRADVVVAAVRSAAPHLTPLRRLPLPDQLPSLSAISLGKLAASCGHISFVYLAKRMKFTRNPNKLPQKLNKLELIIKVDAKKKREERNEKTRVAGGEQGRKPCLGESQHNNRSHSRSWVAWRLFVVKSFRQCVAT